MLRHLASISMRAHHILLSRAAAAPRTYASTRAQPVFAISAPIRAPSQINVPSVRPSHPPSLWQLYLRSLDRRPLVTKAGTAFTMTLLSDSLAQLLGGVAGYSLWRCVRLGLYSASVGALTGHYWHRFLDSKCCPEQPKSWRAVGSKLALDQLVFTPVMTCAFLAFLKAAEGQPHMILPFLSEKLASTLVAGYTVWPAVNIICFRFIPQDLRVLFGSVVGLFWGTYVSLSCVNATRACPEPGTHVAAVVEGTQLLHVLERATP